MKLIKIFAHGFKSFADPVTLTFDGGVTGIVGPNGSGKSNINDAVRWVLGESSSKQLRGDKMSDVIFLGSKTAPEMDRAEVTLTFDNSDRAIAHLEDTFTISRVIERGVGGNQYYVNGELARQKDIKEIAMETGISKSSLAIISQGTVADIAEATPIQRRGIFEEAAGVSKYKSRKEEAERKLERTAEALEKVDAVIAEQEKQLKPLRKQAEKAKIYLEKSKELKEVEIGLLVNNISYYGAKLAELEEEVNGVNETKDDLRIRISKAEDVIAQKTTFKTDLEKEVQKLKEERDKINGKLHSIDVANAKESERRRLIYNGQTQASREEMIETLRHEIELTNTTKLRLEQEKSKIEAQLAEYKTKVDHLNDKKSSLSIEYNNNEKSFNSISGRLLTLKDQLRNKTNMLRGTKVVLDNKFLFKGLKGIVSDLLKFDLEYATAMGQVLRSASQNLVVENPDVAIAAINFLKENRGGRATFIPLSSISPKYVRQDHLYILEGQVGFVGIASDLAKCDVRYEVLSKFLLGTTIVCETIESANKISLLLDKRYTIVSLDGDIIRPGGIIQGGEKTHDSTIGLEEQIEKLSTVIPSYEDKRLQITTAQTEVDIQLDQYRGIFSSFEAERFKNAEKLTHFESQLQDLKIRYKNLAAEEIQLSNEESKDIDVNILQSRIVEISALLSAKEAQVSALGADAARLTLEKLEIDKTLRHINDKFNQQIRDKDRAEMVLTRDQTRLSEHYKITFEMAQESHKLEMDYAEAEAIVKELRSEIDALGSVNVEALEQFEELEARYNLLVENKNELDDAKSKIEEAIKHMDKIIITRLNTVMAEVDKEINEVFSTMFGGGSATVRFTDPNNVLESGVDIEAQPPGKNIRNLRLFSGGEKSLIAISLLFAIIKAKPLPLCILDEVEAALDEANVVRYAEYLQKLKENTQFLVITHRHGTMSNVDRLIGATMQKRGITSFFTVSLKDARKIVDEFEKSTN